MFDANILLFVLLAGASAGGLAYVFMYGRISAEKRVDQRFASVRATDQNTGRSTAKLARDRQTDAARRRKSIQDSLNELDQKQKERNQSYKRPPLKTQLKQAGVEVTIERFYIYSVVCGFVLTIIGLIAGLPLLVLPGVLLAGTLGLPRWYVSFKRKRRIKAFLNEFPNSLDIIVRAIKSGLPLNDGIRLIAHEAREPVKSEFRRIVEAQQIGLSIPDAASRMGETMPCPEANFFGIVIQIQSQAGGNLSEALGNLSRVLRDRKRMKQKVSALSMEARASAAIIGALPFIVALLVYMSSPAYIMPLFTTNIGNLLLVIAAVWMSIGLFVMRQMINFEV